MKRIATLIIFIALLIPCLPALPAAAQGPLNAPDGFDSDVFAGGLSQPTAMAFGPDGALYVTTYGDGAIHALTPQGDRVVISGLNQPLGLTFQNGLLYVSTKGEISTVSGWEAGAAPNRRVIITGLPNGRHQNDNIVFGPDGKLYIGNGSTNDVGPQASPLSAAILRANADGSGLEVFASGLRNPYGLVFSPKGELFATDNGPDAVFGPDELNHIIQNGNYGFPTVFGTPPAGSGTVAPVANFENHAAATGLTFYTGSQFPAEYQGNIFATLWGSSIGPRTGHKLVRVQLTPSGNTYTGQVTDFVTNLANPIDVKMGPDGALYVADYGRGTIYRIFYAGQPTPTPPTIPGEQLGPDVIFFPETGSHLSFGFSAFWLANGGLPIFGYPITEEIQENGRTVQYFERARFEFHPDLAGTPFSVQLGLLGRELTANRLGEKPFQRIAPFPNSANHRFFQETGHSLAFGFKSYWEANGGLEIFGYPISEEFTENGLTVQYFERARLEFHPDLAGTPFSVQLGLLGREVRGSR